MIYKEAIMSELSRIQQELKAPKGQLNSFGGYKYRSCEDILEAVKPLLGESELTLSDTIIAEGGRVYVRAEAKLVFKDRIWTTTAYAREPENKKGMDESQITGAASSYARKYALNGLFAIDDTKDADTMDNTQKDEIRATSTVTDDLTAVCPLHNIQMVQGIGKKTGLPYHYHRDQNGMCFGKGYQEKK
jgi:hypothetical protein